MRDAPLRMFAGEASITLAFWTSSLPFSPWLLKLTVRFSVYSETCIKRTPSIKRIVAKVPKFVSLNIYFK